MDLQRNDEIVRRFIETYRCSDVTETAAQMTDSATFSTMIVSRGSAELILVGSGRLDGLVDPGVGRQVEDLRGTGRAEALGVREPGRSEHRSAFVGPCELPVRSAHRRAWAGRSRNGNLHVCTDGQTSP